MLRASISGTLRRVRRLLLALAAACGSGAGTTRVVIPPGATLRVAADSLQRAGVISSTRLFRFYASLRGRDRRIRAGTYVLTRAMSWGAVARAHSRRRQGTRSHRHDPRGVVARARSCRCSRERSGVEQDSVLAAARDTRDYASVSTSRLRRSKAISFPTRIRSRTGHRARRGRDDGEALRAGVAAGVERAAATARALAASTS